MSGDDENCTVCQRPFQSHRLITSMMKGDKKDRRLEPNGTRDDHLGQKCFQLHRQITSERKCKWRYRHSAGCKLKVSPPIFAMVALEGTRDDILAVATV
jgi:hypothetical protein